MIEDAVMSLGYFSEEDRTDARNMTVKSELVCVAPESRLGAMSARQRITEAFEQA